MTEKLKKLKKLLLNNKTINDDDYRITDITIMGDNQYYDKMKKEEILKKINTEELVYYILYFIKKNMRELQNNMIELPEHEIFDNNDNLTITLSSGLILKEKKYRELKSKLNIDSVTYGLEEFKKSLKKLTKEYVLPGIVPINLLFLTKLSDEDYAFFPMAKQEKIKGIINIEEFIKLMKQNGYDVSFSSNNVKENIDNFDNFFELIKENDVSSYLRIYPEKTIKKENEGYSLKKQKY